MRLSLLGSVFWMSAVLAGVASCQTANQSPATAVAPLAAPQLSPGGAYQEALRPLTVTRASVANWSLSEQAALAVAIKQAAEACAARSAANWSGDCLVDLGHLCALGQSFPAAITAADAYLKETVPAKPRLAEVYAIKVDAELRLKDETSAFATTREMLAAVPYGPQVGDATSEAINFMQLLYTRDATALALARQPKLLAMMHASGAVTEPGNANTGAAVPDVGTLYREALVLPELQQLAGQESAAAASAAAIDAALPSALSVDDQLAIAGWRRRYAQLGQPLGDVSALRSLTLPAKMPQIPAQRAITALLLFPDWCPQCIELARQIPVSVFTVEGHEAYMYGLLVETVPPQKLAQPKTQTPGQPEAFNPAFAAALLHGISAVVVGSDVITRFHAVDVPLLIVCDSQGIVRLITSVDESALRPGNTVDSAVASVGRQWPAYTPPKDNAPPIRPAEKSRAGTNAR